MCVQSDEGAKIDCGNTGHVGTLAALVAVGVSSGHENGDGCADNQYEAIEKAEA